MNRAHNVVSGVEPHRHYVQFYKADEPLLNRNVATFLWNGLLAGDGLLVIATRQRRDSIVSCLERLGTDVALARREGQLTLLDAHEMLARILRGGRPDWIRFQDTVQDALRSARPRSVEAGVSAYGEMV